MCKKTFLVMACLSLMIGCGRNDESADFSDAKIQEPVMKEIEESVIEAPVIEESGSEEPESVDESVLQVDGYSWEWFIEPGEYQEITLFDDFIAVRGQNGKDGLMDYDKNMITDFQYFNIYEAADGIAAFSDGEGGCSFVDKNGESVSGVIYDYVRSFHGGMAAVQKDDKWGFIDKNGTLVLDYIYDDVKFDGFCEGYAVVKQNGTWQFIDEKGKNVFGAGYEDAKAFHEGLAAVQISGKWGYIDTNGSVKIEPKYEKVGNFSEGLAAVCSVIDDCEKWAYIDSRENIKIDYRMYDVCEGNVFTVGEFHNGYAMVTDPLYCLMDTEGKIVFGEDGYFIGWGYHEDLDCVVAYDLPNPNDMSEEKYGLSDLDGNVMLPFIFDSITSVHKNLFAVVYNGEYGVVGLKESDN